MHTYTCVYTGGTHVQGSAHPRGTGGGWQGAGGSVTMSSFNTASSGGVLMWTRAPIAAGTPQGGGSVCVCVCVCVCVVCECTYTQTYIHTCIYVYIQGGANAYTYGGRRGRACMQIVYVAAVCTHAERVNVAVVFTHTDSVHVLHTCLHTYMYVHIHIYYISVYIHTHTCIHVYI